MAAYERAADSDRPSITDLLLQMRQGSPDAVDRLFPLVYGELRRIAHRQLQGCGSPGTGNPRGME